MKTLKQYVQDIQSNKDNPVELSEISNILSADYMACADAIIPIKLLKSIEWTKIKRSESKPLSDSLTEKLWQQTKEGQEEIKLKYRMKALEKALASIKSYIYIKNVEANNQF